MSLSVPSSIQPILDRWNGFASKVKERLQEVLAEANTGFDEVMHTEIVDPAAMSGALTAFEARIRGLKDKVNQAWEKIEGELDQVIQATEDSQACVPMYQIRTEKRNESYALTEKIQTESDTLRIHKEAKAARLLGDVAKKEMQVPHLCHQCKAEIKNPTPHRAANVTCPYCQAVNSLVPGIATGMYFQGSAMHQLAQEAALVEWFELQRAEKHYQGFRHPTNDDLTQFENATKVYWQKYCEAQEALLPDWDVDTVKREVQGKMGHFYKFVAEAGMEERKHLSSVLKFAAARDRTNIVTLLKQYFKDPGSFAEAASEAAYEHGDLKSLEFLLDITHELQASTEPKADFIREKQSDMDRFIGKKDTQ